MCMYVCVVGGGGMNWGGGGSGVMYMHAEGGEENG